ncbi:hypothetical protein T492DRAFT_849041 [Pavlovales sp. CCMP2436]|nr:hypothetical protein T492DRAFT_849041 [Pavlovales sp. CCMP2436]
MPSVCTGTICAAKPKALGKRPSYAREGSPATFCRRCTGADCEAKPLALRKRPSYARDGEQAVFCQACAAHDPLLIDVNNKRCTGIDCEAKLLALRKRPSYARDGEQAHTAANSDFGDGSMCALCYAVPHPKAPMKRDLHTKERMLLAWLEAFMANAPSHLSMRHDQVVLGGCGKERPDFCIDVLSHVIILECDENRHARELAECRQQRAWRISDSFGGRPVVFLRFNPYRFVDKQGAVHQSCFALKRGVLTLAREAAWLERLGLVEARLRYHLAKVPDAHLVEDFLFYGDDSRAREAEPTDVPYMAPACPYTAFSRAIKRARAI